MELRSALRPACTALVAGALVAAAATARAACTNLLSNPGFDVGVTGWNAAASGGGVDVYLVAAPDDRGGDPGEFAGLVTNDSTGAGVDVGTFALESNLCAGVVAGDSVHVTGWIWIPPLQGATGFASIALRWSDLSHCDGTLGFADTTTVSAPGGWTYVDDVMTAPPAVDSFRIGLSVTKNPAGGTFVAYFDDLSVCVPEPAALPCARVAAAALLVLGARARFGAASAASDSATR